MKDLMKIAIPSVLGVILMIGLVGSVYTVDEGKVGIVKTWGKAVKQVNPGLHFKMPIADEVVEIEVRTRKNVETMSIATSEQMAAKAIKQKAQALKNNPAVIDYMRAERWSGNYPTTMMGNNPNVLMQLK